MCLSPLAFNTFAPSIGESVKSIKEGSTAAATADVVCRFNIEHFSGRKMAKMHV